MNTGQFATNSLKVVKRDLALTPPWHQRAPFSYRSKSIEYVVTVVVCVKTSIDDFIQFVLNNEIIVKIDITNNYGNNVFN